MLVNNFIMIFTIGILLLYAILVMSQIWDARNKISMFIYIPSFSNDTFTSKYAWMYAFLHVYYNPITCLWIVKYLSPLITGDEMLWNICHGVQHADPGWLSATKGTHSLCVIWRYVVVAPVLPAGTLRIFPAWNLEDPWVGSDI